MKTDDTASTPAATDGAPESSAKAAKTVAPVAPPKDGDKVNAIQRDPSNLYVVGWDGDAPATTDNPIIHRIHDAERLTQIRRDKLDDLEAAIEAAGEVQVPVTALKVKIDGQMREAIMLGRRRTLATRNINARRKEAGLAPLTLKVIYGNVNDEKLWIKVHSENAGRAPESPLAIASAVTRMLEGDPQLGLPAMTHAEVAKVFGNKNHQWSRAFAKLDAASPKVKAALRKDQLTMTAAQEIAVLKTHEEQDAALTLALAEGGGKKATAKAAKAGTAATREGKDEIEVPVGRGDVKAAIRGLESIACDQENTVEERRDALAALNVLRWQAGQEEDVAGWLEGRGADKAGEVAERFWLLAANAVEKGAKLLETDKAAEAEAKAAEKAEEAAEKARKAELEKQEAKAKAAKEKAEKTAADVKAKAQAKLTAAKEKADKVAAEAQAKADKATADAEAAAKAAKDAAK